MYNTNKEDISREIIALMLQLARKDDYFDEKEFYYILQIAEAMNISPDEMRRIQMSLDDFDFSPPSNEQERMTILYYMLFCMKSDGVVKDEEIRLVQKIGFRLGFRQQLTDDLILTVKKYADTKLPPEEMLASLKKYLN